MHEITTNNETVANNCLQLMNLFPFNPYLRLAWIGTTAFYVVRQLHPEKLIKDAFDCLVAKIAILSFDVTNYCYGFNLLASDIFVTTRNWATSIHIRVRLEKNGSIEKFAAQTTTSLTDENVRVGLHFIPGRNKAENKLKQAFEVYEKSILLGYIDLSLKCIGLYSYGALSYHHGSVNVEAYEHEIHFELPFHKMILKHTGDMFTLKNHFQERSLHEYISQIF